MPRQTWVINSTTGGNDNTDLIGCVLKQTDTGFEFKSGDNLLASTNNTTVPFTFSSFPFDGHNWTISVDSITGGPSNNQASGTWTNDDPTIQGAEDGTWVGQAGGGAGEDDGDQARSATL
jgi:hypothetical protein